MFKLSKLMCIALACVLLPTAACDDAPKEKTAEATPAKKADSPKEVSAVVNADEGSDLALDPFPLTAKAPVGIKARPSGKDVAVMAFGTSMIVSETTPEESPTADGGKAWAEKKYKATNWNAEEVDGGYIATFESSDSASKGTSYVYAYRKLGDKAYRCFTSTRKPEKVLDRAKDFCKSLAAK